MEDFSAQGQSESKARSKLTFQNFVAGEGNSAAFAAARDISESPGVKYNPFYIYCGVGQGKSHLLHALGRDFKKKNPDGAVLLVNGEEFAEELAQARDNQAFRERFSQPDILLIDDFHLLSETDRTEVLRIFETLQSKNRQLVLTSLRTPRELIMDERLRSRIEGGLVCKILPPDLQTRIRILKLKAQEAGVSISQSALEEIARRVTLNVRKLEGAINRLAVLSKAKGQEISSEFVESALRDMMPEFPGEPAAPYEESPGVQKEEFGDFILEVAKTMSVIRQEPSEEARMREAYAEKLYVWEMKGFKVDRLKAVLDKKMDVVTREFITFTSDVQRLIELQNRYGALNAKRFTNEAAKIEALLFDPDAVTELTKRINRLETRLTATSLDLIEDYTFDRFSVDRPNEEAYKLCRSVAQSPWASPDLVFLWGGQGTGKSHLLNAVAKELYAKRNDINVFLLHGEIFVDDLKMERGRHTRGKLRERCIEADLLLADDVQSIFDNQISSNEFMAILEQRIEQKKKMILVSDLPPDKTYVDPGFERLVSKGVVCEIGAPSENLKQAIARNFLMKKDVKVSSEEIETICAGVGDNLWELMDKLDHVVAEIRGETTLIEGTPVVVDKSALRPVAEEAEVKPPVKEVEEVAAPPVEEFDLDRALGEKPPVKEVEEVAVPPAEKFGLDRVLEEKLPVEEVAEVPVSPEVEEDTLDRLPKEKPPEAEAKPPVEDAEGKPAPALEDAGPELILEEKLSEIRPGEADSLKKGEVGLFAEEAEEEPVPSLAEPGLDLVIGEMFSEGRTGEFAPAEEDTSVPESAAERVESLAEGAEEKAIPPMEDRDLEKILEDRLGGTLSPDTLSIQEDKPSREAEPLRAEDKVLSEEAPLKGHEYVNLAAELTADKEEPPKEEEDVHPSLDRRAENIMDTKWEVDDERLMGRP